MSDRVILTSWVVLAVTATAALDAQRRAWEPSPGHTNPDLAGPAVVRRLFHPTILVARLASPIDRVGRLGGWRLIAYDRLRHGASLGLASFLSLTFRSRSALAAENVFLRKQLALYLAGQRSSVALMRDQPR